MAQMNVSLPDPMKDWCQSQVGSGKYATASDYVRDLIRKDQEQQALQAAITKGLESGLSKRSMDEILREARRRASKAG